MLVRGLSTLPVSLLVAATVAQATLPPVEPRLVANLGDPGVRLEVPYSDVATLGDRVLFLGVDSLHGVEPWTSDGTASGTRLLADLRPGHAGQSLSFGTGFHVRGGIAYFGLPEAVWRTDGSWEGTWRLGPAGPPFELVAFLGDRPVLHRQQAGAFAPELWLSDGTSAGERRITELDPATIGPLSLVVELDDEILLVTDGGLESGVPGERQPSRLWRSDGTAAGTSEVGTFPYLEHQIWLGVHDGVARIASQRHGDAVWQVYELPLAGGGMVAAGTLPDFSSLLRADDGIYLVLDRTQAAFLSSADLAAGAQPSLLPPVAAAVDLELVGTVDDKLLFVACEAHGTPCELRSWDGVAVRVLAAAVDGFVQEVGNVGGGAVIASAGSGDPGPRLHWTDGVEVRDLGAWDVDRPGAVLDGRLHLVHGAFRDTPALLVTDGTAGGTAIVRDFSRRQDGSRPTRLIRHGDEVWFLAAATGDHVEELDVWRSDGTAAGTHVVASPPYLDRESDLRSAGDRVLLSADRGLHALDAMGASLVSPGSCFSSVIRSEEIYAIEMADERAFFRCATEGGQPLWTLGPSDDLAMPVVDVDPEFFNDHSPAGVDYPVEPPIEITAWPRGSLAGGATFVGTDGTSALRQPQLWYADSAGDEARLLHTFALAHASDPWYEVYPRHVTHLSGRPDLAVFAGYESATGWDLWRTDGTADGTFALGAIAGHEVGGVPFIVPHRGGAAAVVRDLSGLDELWISDGTAAGTRRVSRLRRDGRGAEVETLVAVGDRLYMAVYHPALGSELWTSDGTTQGTVALDLAPGRAGSRPHHLTAVGDVLLYAADDGDHGSELWRSDGTAAGTTRLTDVAPGPDSANPGELVVVADRLLFAAADRDHGREPWAIDDLPRFLASTAPCGGVAHCFQNGRFRVTVTWDDDVTNGSGRPVAGATDDSGLFTFFSDDNWELLVKVLDGCEIDGTYWVFAAAATHVGYTLEVLDRATGERRTWTKAYGPPAPALTATGVFSCPLPPAP